MKITPEKKGDYRVLGEWYAIKGKTTENNQIGNYLLDALVDIDELESNLKAFQDTLKSSTPHDERDSFHNWSREMYQNLYRVFTKEELTDIIIRMGERIGELNTNGVVRVAKLEAENEALKAETELQQKWIRDLQEALNIKE